MWECCGLREMGANPIASTGSWHPLATFASPDVNPVGQGSKRSGNLGAGEGNRTLVVTLATFCSTIELRPLVIYLYTHISRVSTYGGRVVVLTSIPNQGYQRFSRPCLGPPRLLFHVCGGRQWTRPTCCMAAPTDFQSVPAPWLDYLPQCHASRGTSVDPLFRIRVPKVMIG